MAISGTYKITCIPTGDFYIGASINISKRKTLHESEARCGKKKGLFKELVDTYGYDEFEFKMLRYIPEELLREEEEKLIEKTKPTLNISKGFGTCKYERSVYIAILLFKYNNITCKLMDARRAFPDVSERVVSDVINLRKYTWLEKECPIEYHAVMLALGKSI